MHFQCIVYFNYICIALLYIMWIFISFLFICYFYDFSLAFFWRIQILCQEYENIFKIQLSGYFVILYVYLYTLINFCFKQLPIKLSECSISYFSIFNASYLFNFSFLFLTSDSVAYIITPYTMQNKWYLYRIFICLIYLFYLKVAKYSRNFWISHAEMNRMKLL